MGLRHLVQVRKLLRKGKKLTFGELREKTNMNFNTLTECLSYLVDNESVKKTEDGYLWSANMSEKEENALRPTACSLGNNDTTRSKPRKAKSTE